MDQLLLTIAAFGFIGWLYLLFGRGGFWLGRECLDDAPSNRPFWPAVCALVPARDEAAVIGRTLRALLAQDYPGPFRIILIDDHSADGTADVARRAAAAAARDATILNAAPLPPGWTGKLWALSQGATQADAELLWLTDADIEHDPDTLRRLVAKAEDDRRDLVSLMVLLSCESFWEKLLIPPFVFFFQMLYPFAWANDPSRRMAAAAGGCVLIRRAVLERAGGLGAIRGAVIDDCALARRVKREGEGRSWLGLTRSSRSVRPYDGFSGLWSMVARSAYEQLGRSPALLAATLLGMALLYLAPPLLLLSAPLHGSNAALIGGATWLLMTIAILPTLRLYRRSPAWALTLPVAACLYCAMTFDSALATARGRGGFWKGRVQGASAPRKTTS